MTSLLLLLNRAGPVCRLLAERRETISVSESSAGGLISTALLSLPGASAYFMGGAVTYTATARAVLAGITSEEMTGLRSSSEPYALLLARKMRERLGTTWSIAETGAAGPFGNRYGDMPGHSCFAVSGPIELVRTLETGEANRWINMQDFAYYAFVMLEEALSATAPRP